MLIEVEDILTYHLHILNILYRLLIDELNRIEFNNAFFSLNLNAVKLQFITIIFILCLFSKYCFII